MIGGGGVVVLFNPPCPGGAGWLCPGCDPPSPDLMVLSGPWAMSDLVFFVVDGSLGLNWGIKVHLQHPLQGRKKESLFIWPNKVKVTRLNVTSLVKMFLFLVEFLAWKQFFSSTLTETNSSLRLWFLTSFCLSLSYYLPPPPVSSICYFSSSFFLPLYLPPLILSLISPFYCSFLVLHFIFPLKQNKESHRHFGGGVRVWLDCYFLGCSQCGWHGD